MSELLPLFLNLTGRAVVLVGGGPVATAKLGQLLAAGAQVRIVAPDVTGEIESLVARRAQNPDPGAGGSAADVVLARRAFEEADLDGAWLAVAAATPEVNRQVAEAAAMRRVFVNAVDDPANASAFLSGVVRRDGVTLAISTSGAAPALTALLREGLDALLPRDLAGWMWQARAARVAWRREGVPMASRKPLLLQALNALYSGVDDAASGEPLSAGSRHSKEAGDEAIVPSVIAISAADRPRVPWLNGPEDSWL